MGRHVGILGGLGLGAFMLASLVVGARLLWLATRTRRLPEFGIGSCFFLAGGFGYPLLVLGNLFHDLPPELRYPLSAAGLLAFHVGSAALWIAVWRIFRPDTGWALAIVTGAVALLAITFARDALVHRQPIPPRATSWYWVGVYARIGCLLWAALESLHYHRRLVRRLPLGLTDRETVMRFLCWGLASAAAFCMSANAVALRLVPGYKTHPLALTLSSILGLSSAVLIWITFFPPAGLRRRWAAATGIAAS